MDQIEHDDWITANVDRLRLVASAEEADALCLVFCDESGAVRLCSIIHQAMTHLDDRLTRSLANVIAQAGPPRVVLVVRRAGASPSSVDRRLWADLQVLLEGDPVLQDLIVLDDVAHWSARAA